MSRLRSPRRLLVSGLVPILLTAVVGCGSDDAGTSDGGESAASSTETSQSASPSESAPTDERLTTETFLPALKKAMKGKESVHMSMRMVGGGQRVLIKGASKLDDKNPDSTFDACDAGVGDVEFVAEESVNGEPTEHYAITVDSAAAMKAQGQQVVPGMPETIEYDLWLDDQRLMRKMSFDVGDQAQVVGTMSRWGEPVVVKAPPARLQVAPPQT